METIHSIAQTREALAAVKARGDTVALVPTMGNLHEGHLSLIRHAHTLADYVVASIFVNPLQFGPNEDLDSYPRTLAEDTDKLQAEKTDLLFAPSAKEMYPAGTSSQTEVKVPGLSAILCGQSRPTHFAGVATVVCKLLNIVSPDVSVFGLKDFQQLIIIRTMAEDLLLPGEIVGCPIVRESTGLAMSSRNNYLDEKESNIAPMLNQTIRAAKSALESGNQDHAQIENEATVALEKAGFVPDYVSIRNARSLESASPGDSDLVILAAAYLGKTRLIDNLQVNLSANR
jgi:pantoate--beta-alanine ligase|tara:strand:- start:25161 stop:26021 length:861 start_codon:yes stop_codon:yes gene_type:complete